jgi:hypothetical protein
MIFLKGFDMSGKRKKMIADLRLKVKAGIESANPGELSDGDEFFAELGRDEQIIAASPPCLPSGSNESR